MGIGGVTAMGCTVGQGLSYYLAYPPDRAQQPKIRVLREWLSQRSIPARPD